ncbi:MAG: tail fiber protein [Nevskia sp.]|nr:tail fiber protein [Nevskia sp.]
MSDFYISELRIFPFGFAPRGWLQCNGQLVTIAEYEPLFALLGTTYGGDGITTFALPDLRGRVPIGVSTTNVQGEIEGGDQAISSVGGITPKRGLTSTKISGTAIPGGSTNRQPALTLNICIAVSGIFPSRT